MLQGLILDPATKQAALELSERTLAKYSNVRGHYSNTKSSHLVGHLGEFAAFIWLRDNGFEPVPRFLDPDDKECDIHTRIGRIEVKTWRDRFWDDLGRCVSVTQYPSIKRKADFIFWNSIADPDAETPQVTFRGWCKVSQFDKAKEVIHTTGFPQREIRNLQLPQSKLLPVEKLHTL